MDPMDRFTSLSLSQGNKHRANEYLFINDGEGKSFRSAIYCSILVGDPCQDCHSGTRDRRGGGRGGWEGGGEEGLGEGENVINETLVFVIISRY